MWGNSTFFRVAGIGLVVVVIGVPLIVGQLFFSRTVLHSSGDSQSINQEAGSKFSHRKRFEESIQFSKDAPVMRIAHDVRFNPDSDQFKTTPISKKDPRRDFWAFFAVVKVKHLSAKGARHIFALKYDADKPLHSGWGIAFNRMGNEIFPEVYWGTATKKGQWYRFMPVPVHSGDWWAVGLSFEEDRYLVLHTQPLSGDTEHDMLLVEEEPQSMGPSQTSLRSYRGAYDLKDAGAASSSADLMLGASPGSNFKGGFGFFGVARVNARSSQDWFTNAVKMIDSATHATNAVSDAEGHGELSGGGAFKSDKLDFILGSFDGKHEVVTDSTLP